MTAPQHASIESSDDLTARMDYFCEAVKVLRATTRPDRQPVVSRPEYAQMLSAYALGLTAAGFAARLAARDRAKVAS